MNAKLARGLANLRRRILAISLAAGIGWGVAVCVAALVAWMWLDLVLDFPGAIRAGAGALLAAVGILALAAPQLAGTQWARFTDPFGDHPPFSRVKLEVQPGDVKIVYGQGFDIRVMADGGPIEKAEVVLAGENGAA